MKTPPPPVLFEVVRPERNPVFVGWYCRSCAQKVRGKQH